MLLFQQSSDGVNPTLTNVSFFYLVMCIDTIALLKILDTKNFHTQRIHSKTNENRPQSKTAFIFDVIVKERPAGVFHAEWMDE